MKTYLGDGLYADYAEDHGFHFRLFTPQGMEVFLDDDVMESFFAFVEHARNVKISMQSREQEQQETATDSDTVQ